jgi:hypothetical protein
MSKERLLAVLVGVLVVLNVATVTMLLMGEHRPPGPPPPPGPPGGGGPKGVIIERLHFDADQIKAYDALIEEHRAQIREKDEAMMTARRELYASLASPTLLQTDSLLATIAAVQRDVEGVNYAHFGHVRALCHPDQLADFDALATDLADYFRPRGPDHR